MIYFGSKMILKFIIEIRPGIYPNLKDSYKKLLYEYEL